MAKNTSAVEKARTEAIQPFVPPEGFELLSDGQVVGYWDPRVNPYVYVRPLHGIVFDNSLDKEKVSTLIVCEACEDTPVVTKEGDTLALKGDLIGLWGKAGMRHIIMAGGTECYVAHVGEKDVGKASPMMLFKVYTKGTRNLIPLTEDKREESAEADTWWSTSAVDTTGDEAF